MDWDVIVVGASSAGLHAAAQLARAGKRVAVFEQARVLRPARRTLIVTPHLKRILASCAAPVLMHRISDLVLASADAQTRVSLRDPDLIIERGALLEQLTAHARAEGVQFFFGHRFLACAPHGAGARLEFRADAERSVFITADAVLAADGVFSDVARAVGLKPPPSVPILQAEIELPPQWDPAVTQVWFDTDATRFFYWLVPESNTRAVVGLVGDERAQLRYLLRRFLDRHGFNPLAYQGARIALYAPRLQVETHIGATRVLLIGDAAGQVKVTTVGGTVSGLLGAEAAARALLGGSAYAAELKGVRRELELHWWMRIVLDRLGDREYDQLVRGVTPRLREFLAQHNRDELAGVAWRLPWLMPQLVRVLPAVLWSLLYRRSTKAALPAQAHE